MIDIHKLILLLLASVYILVACSKDDDLSVREEEQEETIATIDTLTTTSGVEYVITPEENFENLPDWPYDPLYMMLDEMRQAYIDEGDPNGKVVLLLHGNPSWSYLYRKMIPVFVDAG